MIRPTSGVLRTGMSENAGVAPLFELDGVRVDGDDGEPILHDLTASIPSGLTVVLGPSGSGKSTMLRLCNRFVVPAAGTVRFRGDDVAGLDPLTHRRRVGMVFQRPTMFDGTVFENLLVAAPELDRDRAGVLLERVALDPELLDRAGEVISGGEAQRATVARALATDPDVLLLDEPTSALDPASTRQLEQTITDLVAGGLGVVWVTHELEQVERIAPDHRIVLVDGRPADAHETDHYLHAEPLDHAADEHPDHHTRDSSGGPS